MTIDLKIPESGESVQEVQIVRWNKQEGEQVDEDEMLVELETDKASLDLPSPASGTIAEILKAEGESAAVGETICRIREKGDESEEASPRNEESAPPSDSEEQAESKQEAESQNKDTNNKDAPEKGAASKSVPTTPSARRELHEHGLTAEQVPLQGKRLRGKDVRRFAKRQQADAPRGESRSRSSRASEAPNKPEDQKGPRKREQPEKSEKAEKAEKAEKPEKPEKPEAARSQGERVVPLSPLRRRIAQNLVAAQQEAALLTTFNEVDMSAVICLREEHGERFREAHGVKLGFMSFFMTATVHALREFPELNAEIRGDNAVYRDSVHLGVAVSTEAGLVVPVVRSAERMGFAQLETTIADLAERARAGELTPDDLRGGTFTISNGGVYGSLLSTPIVNPPQSAVLGMHAIEQRPVGREGRVVLRPMMYLALTYDHRLIDGREAVSFLRRIREAVESPARMLLDV